MKPNILLVGALVASGSLAALPALAKNPPAPKPAPSVAPTPPPKDWSGLPAMNGFAFEKYRGFWKSWHLVTVRHRTDTKELRYIYANDLAWKTMQEGKIDYPDGAIFGKIGFAAATDPMFESSVVPGVINRFQLMVMDRQRFPETEGWGYAIFNGHGVTMPEDPVAVTQSCHVCHLIARPRGLIFALPYEARLDADFPVPANVDAAPPMVFETRDLKSFPQLEKLNLGSKSKSVRVLTGELSRALFAGILNEIIPALVRESSQSHLPAVLISPNGETFSLVDPLPAESRAGVPRYESVIRNVGVVDKAGQPQFVRRKFDME